MNCLKFALSNDCSIDRFAVCAAAHKGRVDVLHYLLNNRVPIVRWNNGTSFLFSEWNEIMNVAALGGQTECVKLIHKNGFEMNNETCNSAVEGGNLECLMYVHKNLGKLSDIAAICAAKHGSLECLKYIHEVELSWVTMFAHQQQ